MNSENKPEKLCYQCNGNHTPETCPFKEKECFYCKSKGHTIKVCRKKQKLAKNHSANQLNQLENCNGKDFDDYDDDDILEIFQLTSNANPPLTAKLLVNGNPIIMKIDTGASTSLVNYKTFIKPFCNANKMTSTSSKIRTYTGEVVSPMGEVELEFIYDNQKAVTSVIIMEGNYSNLLGRDILRKIKLNWEELFNHNN